MYVLHPVFDCSMCLVPANFCCRIRAALSVFIKSQNKLGLTILLRDETAGCIGDNIKHNDS